MNELSIPLDILLDPRLTPADKIVWAVVRAYPGIKATRGAAMAGINRWTWYNSLKKINGEKQYKERAPQPAQAPSVAMPSQPQPQPQPVEPPTTGPWAEAICKNYDIDEEGLRAAIERAKLYCLSNEIELTTQNIKRYTNTDLQFNKQRKQRKRAHELSDAHGRFYIWGGFRYDIPRGAPPRPSDTHLWDRESQQWKQQ
jgi:hypothetical protein